MLYESKRVQFRNTCGSEIILQDGTPNGYPRGGVSNNQGMVMVEIWLHSEIGNSDKWQDNSRGAF